jgi:glyoxylase-like metal-dependent hydrolase (beta-lactamase superfamily II)
MDTNCYLFSNGKKECIIIDPGGNEETVISNISMLKMIPVGIVLTHGHFDHTASVGKIKDLYAQDDIELKIAIHKADKNFLGKRAAKTNSDTLREMGVPPDKDFEKLFTDFPTSDIILQQDDEVFSTGLIVIETPGHTPGSICLYSEKDSLVFSGDTLFFQGIGRTDLPGSSEEMLLAGIRSKLLTLPPETRVYPGHGLSTSIEREIIGNPFIRS